MHTVHEVREELSARRARSAGVCAQAGIDQVQVHERVEGRKQLHIIAKRSARQVSILSGYIYSDLFFIALSAHMLQYHAAVVQCLAREVVRIGSALVMLELKFTYVKNDRYIDKICFLL